MSLSCDPAYTFSIDGHELTVIEADGVETHPVTVNAVQIFAAQRYSFVVSSESSKHVYREWKLKEGDFQQVTANQTIDNYWIRANPNLGTLGFAGGINSAILRYDGANLVEPVTSQQPTQNLLKETDLHPFIPRWTVRDQPPHLWELFYAMY